jgi:Tol biopolymer transport system component
MPLEGDRKPVPYLQTRFDENFASLSPDAKWIAYQSDESGRPEVYVQAVPASGAKYQISNAGGSAPAWRRDGKELYYLSPDRKLMAVPIRNGAAIEAGTPQSLFTLRGSQVFAPSRDGQRFLVVESAGGEEAAAVPPVTVVLNWQAGLKK